MGEGDGGDGLVGGDRDLALSIGTIFTDICMAEAAP